LLVGTAVSGVDNGGADQQRPPVGSRLDLGVDQDRQATAIGGPQFHRHPADLALHVQQRPKVSLVVNVARANDPAMAGSVRQAVEQAMASGVPG
jgi:hypothetical protein